MQADIIKLHFMSKLLRWGILGTGNIARQFAAGMGTSQRCQITAVASREAAAARAFADTHSIARFYGSYDALLADADVDAVYLSLPNSLHHPWTLAALRAGKHVLCEKPLAMNAAEAQQMFDAARQAGRLLVEAFMYRSHPLLMAVRDEVKKGTIGELRFIRTSFCYRTLRVDGNIRFNPDLGGGAMMDVGCYCINFARLFAAQEPAIIHAAAHMHSSGVDDIATGTLMFTDGMLAGFTCGMSVQADNTASLCGSDGYIEIPIPWKPPIKQALYHIARATPPRMDLTTLKPPPARQTIAVDAGKDLYALEADDFAAAVFDGIPPRVSEQDSLGNMRVLDHIRGQFESGATACKS